MSHQTSQPLAYTSHVSHKREDPVGLRAWYESQFDSSDFLLSSIIELYSMPGQDWWWELKVIDLTLANARRSMNPFQVNVVIMESDFLLVVHHLPEVSSCIWLLVHTKLTKERVRDRRPVRDALSFLSMLFCKITDPPHEEEKGRGLSLTCLVREMMRPWQMGVTLTAAKYRHRHIFSTGEDYPGLACRTPLKASFFFITISLLLR